MNPAEAGIEIRPLLPADVDEATRVVFEGGWGERRAQFALFADHRPCHAFVAAQPGGRVVGTGVGTVNGGVGWIGTIFVDPAARGRGLGQALTDAAIGAVEAAGCRTLVLTASKLGRPIYERLGFEDDGAYRTLEAPERRPGDLLEAWPAPDPERVVRPFRDGDLGAIVALDRAATGEDRAHLLSALASPESCRVAVRPGADADVRAFRCRSPWGGAAIVAPDPDDAVALLADRRLAQAPGERLVAGLLDSNVDGIARLEGLGWAVVHEIPRMRRGDPLDWEPAAIWGQFGFALG